jgi:hypothetical protein
MKKASVILSTLVGAVLHAQPVFVHPDALPALGGYPVETRNYGTVPDLVTSGTGVVWDFSAQGYSVVGSTTDSILVPSATPYHADYPAATIAVRLVDQFGYYRTTTDSVLDLGYRPGPSSPSQINSDPALIMRLPAAVGDTWTDHVTTGSTPSVLTVTVLAEGTIELADVTIPDAVLVRREQQFPNFNSVSTTWFRRSNCLVPLGNVLPNNGVVVRAPQDLSTGVSQPTAAAEVQIMPNPATEHVRVQRMDGRALGTVTLLDAMGREVRRLHTRVAQADIDLHELPEALYLLRMDDGIVVRTQRVVKGR